MAKLHNILNDVRNHVRKIVYAIEPAAVDGVGERWHAHNTEAGKVQDAAASVRVFEVLPLIGGAKKITEGSDRWDYEVPFVITICYGTNENYNVLMLSDYASISHALHNANVGVVDGLHYYLVEAPPAEVEQDGKRFSVITFQARITASFDNLVFSDDPGGFGVEGFGGV